MFNIKSLKFTSVLVAAMSFAAPVFANNNDGNTTTCTPGGTGCSYDPVMQQLDSMSFSLFTRDKFFVTDAQLQQCIDMPANMVPRYTDEEMKQKMKLIPSLIPLQCNNQVKQFIDFFAYRRRGLMTRCLGNAQIYFPVFEQVLDRKGLPLELKYLPIVESAFNPIAVSRAGATGLWQMMYGTGSDMGLNINSYIDERRDPVKATEAAADYLKKLYDLYGDWHLVLAAYNSGPGNVNKAIARAGGVKNFWAICNYLPAETRSYVPTYIAAVYVMHYYKDYKLVSAEPKRELYAVDTVLITSKVSLQHISNVLNIPVDELQFLNPSVRTGVIPYTQNGFYMNLPISYFAAFEAKEDEIMNDPSMDVKEAQQPMVASVAPKTYWHKVKKHETINSIAAKYGVSVSAIKKTNGLRKSSVYSGQKLKIVVRAAVQAENPAYTRAFAPKVLEKTPATTPADSTVPEGIENNNATELASTEIQDAADTNEAATPVQKVVSPTASATTAKASANVLYHVVQPGDTLWSIAQRYKGTGVTVDKLKASNKAVASRGIRIGDVLKIFR